jgi:hypothetical protein
MFTLVELAIAFAVGYGTRELISQRRRAAERKAYFERLDRKDQQALYDHGNTDLVPRQ